MRRASLRLASPCSRSSLGEHGAEVGQGPSLLAPGPCPAGGVQRLLGRLAGFGVCPAQHEQQLDVPGQDPGPLGRRRLGRDQAHRLLVGGQGAVVEGQPEAASEPLLQRPGPDRVAGRVHPGQGLPQELDRPRVVVGQMGRGGGPLEQADPVEPGQLGRPRHLRPQLQGALEVPLGLGEGVGALGLGAGLDRGRQGPLGVAGGVPVVGELGGHGGVGAAGPPGMGRDGRGHLAVEAGPLARQQVGVGDLAEQGVAELVAVVAGPGHQQLAGDRLPEGLVEPPPSRPATAASSRCGARRPITAATRRACLAGSETPGSGPAAGRRRWRAARRTRRARPPAAPR